MEGNTPRTDGTKTNGDRSSTSSQPLETQGGVSFETPKSVAEVEKENITPTVSLEEVDRELEKAGVSPETITSPAPQKTPPRERTSLPHVGTGTSKAHEGAFTAHDGASSPHDDAPSWLAEKKAALASQTEPAVAPKAAPAPQSAAPTAKGPSLQEAVTGMTKTDPTIQEIKKREYSDLIRPLRTFKDDIARAIQKNKLLGADISVAEQSRRMNRLQEERSQLELKEKIEKDRARLQALAAVKRRAHPVESPAAENVEPPTPSKPAEPVQKPIPAPPPSESISVATGDTYEAGELARQAAAIRGVPFTQPKASPQRKETATDTLKAAEAELARRSDILRESQPVIVARDPGIPRSMKVLLASFVLLVIGAGLLAGTFYINRDRPALLSPLEIETLVFAEAGQEIPVQTVQGDTLMGLLKTRADQTQLPLNAISAFTLTLPNDAGKAAGITTQEWFARAETGANASLVRALHPKFMLGVHSFESNQPFLVFKTSFYENAFAGMLQWEKTMSRDLSPLFGSTVLGDRGGSTATSSAVGSAFRDRLINNIDTRVLVDLNGEVRLLYSFVDRQTLVIATNRDTFLEIVNRLNSTRTQR